ncbi:MAG: starch-binding protein [Clostridia bacterium]|nr:starch-binding protein [Clostridia bacterium]
MKKRLLSLILTVLLLAASITGIMPAAAETEHESYAQDTVQGAAILHCFDWSFESIRAALPEIAAAGYTAVQTSPVQQPKDYIAENVTTSDEWWKLYQPLGLRIAPTENGAATSWLGTRDELCALCGEAEEYGIKVIVDIVANHLANYNQSGGTFANLSPYVDADLRAEEYYHPYSDFVNDTSRFTMTQYQMGMPDLNTSHGFIQNKVLGLLKDCVDCGVDGFRFDAAKHIELPTDPGCASDFWPTVIDGVRDYAGEELFIYGEILGGAGTDIADYTQYMAVTDNETGNSARSNAVSGNAAGLANYYYYKGAAPEYCVLWAESHDTYLDHSTDGISDEDLIKTWAIVGARADSTSLYFARPNDSMGLAGTDLSWKSDAVAEINKFKNHFAGTREYLSSFGNTAYIERASRGVVICRLDGAGGVSLPAHRMADGVYTDQLTGNTFTVSNGTISGTVGSSCVAVVYDPDVPALDAITESPLYLRPASNWLNDGARFAMYLYNALTTEGVWADMTDDDGDGVYSAEVPEGEWHYVIFCRMDPAYAENGWEHKWNQTGDLAPEDGTNCYTVTEGTWDEGGGAWSLYGAPADDTWTVYAINKAGWGGMNIHYWGRGETVWPGIPMESFSGSAVYACEVPAGIAGIVFNNGGSLQTGDITSGIHDGAVFIINNDSSAHWAAAPDYYLSGSMNGWAESDGAYAFSLNPSQEGLAEYALFGVTLTAGTELKVCSSDGGWYPSGTAANYTVARSGVYNVYFRPDHNGNSDWYQGWFYLEAAESHIIGDVNLDGAVDMSDATLLSAYLMNACALEGAALENADANLDGEVSVLDLPALCALAISAPAA